MTQSSSNFPLYPMSDRERHNLNQSTTYPQINSLPEIWPIAAEKFANITAVHSPHHQPVTKLTYQELWQQIQLFASGLQSLGVVNNTDSNNTPPRVALFADDSPQWLIADQGIMTAGGADVVRGAGADPEELLFILQNSGSSSLVVENLALLKKLANHLQDLPIHLIILLSEESTDDLPNLPVITFSQVIEAGKKHTLIPVKLTPQTLATLIYTSGTTGKPKGVMLTHANFLYQINYLGVTIQPTPGEVTLNILPTWHSFGRTGEYFYFSQGCTQIYTNIRYLKSDFQEYSPHYMVSVPRIWESIYEGVQKQLREQPAKKQKLVKFFLTQSRQYIRAKRLINGLDVANLSPSLSQKLSAYLQILISAPIHAIADRIVYGKMRTATGGQLKFATSGGGSLAMHLEDFFETINIGLLVGYGLTETSPVLSARQYWQNLRGSSGRPIPGTEFKIVHLETRQTLSIGEKGLILVRGPQIMAGYYENPEATAKAIDQEGWFNTGDLGYLTANQDIFITGRAKDTIVLTNGENIEPQPIEDACLRSPYIDQIMLVGQDQKSLGALIVPNVEAVEKWAESQNTPLESPPNLDSKIIQDLFRQELNREVKDRPSYRIDDRIGPFVLLTSPFSLENGMLTQTLKIKRNVVMDHYHDMINKMFT